MKYFEFIWIDGKTTYGKGETVAEAAANSGIRGGAFRAIDYFGEINELPLEYKDVVYIHHGKEEELNNQTMFCKLIREKVKEGQKIFNIKIGRANFNLNCNIENFRIVAKEV